MSYVIDVATSNALAILLAKETVSVPAASPRVEFPDTVRFPVTSTPAPNFESKSALIPPVV